MRLFLVTPLALCLYLSLSAASKDSAAIVDQYEIIWQGFDQEHFDPWYDDMLEDVVITTSAHEKLVGLKEVRSFYESILNAIDIQVISWELKNIFISGEMAYGEAAYIAKFPTEENPSPDAMTIDWQFVWKKDQKGNWKIYRETYSPSSDESLIRAVINQETESFYLRKLEVWSDCFVQAPYFTWSVTNSSNPGDVVTKRGFENFKMTVEGWFQNSDPAKSKEDFLRIKSTRNQWQIQVRGNVAWVSFNDHHYDPKDKSSVQSTEMRVLEKVDGLWKICMLAALMDFKDADPPRRSKY